MARVILYVGDQVESRVVQATLFKEGYRWNVRGDSVRTAVVHTPCLFFMYTQHSGKQGWGEWLWDPWVTASFEDRQACHKDFLLMEDWVGTLGLRKKETDGGR